jgi:putative Holliday junction resolvase
VPEPVRPGVRLGVDVGQVRVGVAVSDPAGVLATPLTTLDRDLEGESDLDELARIATEQGAVEVVVGLPRSLSGTEGLAAERARGYAAALHRRLRDVPVRLVDERLTTVDAHRALQDSGVRRRQHRSRVDQAAAVLILQSALDAERATGQPVGRTMGDRKPRARRPRARHEGRNGESTPRG